MPLITRLWQPLDWDAQGKDAPSRHWMKMAVQGLRQEWLGFRNRHDINMASVRIRELKDEVIPRRMMAEEIERMIAAKKCVRALSRQRQPDPECCHAALKTFYQQIASEQNQIQALVDAMSLLHAGQLERLRDNIAFVYDVVFKSSDEAANSKTLLDCMFRETNRRLRQKGYLSRALRSWIRGSDDYIRQRIRVRRRIEELAASQGKDVSQFNYLNRMLPYEEMLAASMDLEPASNALVERLAGKNQIPLFELIGNLLEGYDKHGKRGIRHAFFDSLKLAKVHPQDVRAIREIAATLQHQSDRSSVDPILDSHPGIERTRKIAEILMVFSDVYYEVNAESPPKVTIQERILGRPADWVFEALSRQHGEKHASETASSECVAFAMEGFRNE